MFGLGKKKGSPETQSTFIEETKADLAQFFMIKGMKTDDAIKAAKETVAKYKNKLGEVF